MVEPTLTLYGPDGATVDDPALAASAEIQEYDDQGVPTGRTYLQRPAGDAGIAWATSSSDEDVVAAGDDTGKDTWDLWDPETLEPVTTREQLCRALSTGPDLADQRAALAGMLELPSWQAAPPELQTEVREWLVATRPKTAGT